MPKVPRIDKRGGDVAIYIRDSMKRCKSLAVNVVASNGRPRKTWDQTLRVDLESKT